MIVQEAKNDKYALKVIYDEYPESPREWCNLGKMICFHKRYDLGDKHDYKSSDYNGWDEMESDIIKKENPALILPLYLYDHSGITISTEPFGCPWDSGQIGFVLATKEEVRKNFNIKRVTKKYLDMTEKILLGEVETMDQYVRGDVYGFQLIDLETEEVIDSCFGFYGDLDEIKKEIGSCIGREFEDLVQELK